MSEQYIRIHEINRTIGELFTTSSLIAYKIQEYFYEKNIAIIKKIILINHKNESDTINKMSTKAAYVYLEWNNNETSLKFQDDLKNNEQIIIQISDNIDWEITMQDSSTNVLHNSTCSITTYYMNEVEYHQLYINDESKLTNNSDKNHDYTMYRDNYVEYIITD